MSKPPKPPRQQTKRRPESFPVEIRDLIALLASHATEVKERSFPTEHPLQDALEINKYLAACAANGSPEEKETIKFFSQTYIVGPSRATNSVRIRPRSDTRLARNVAGLLAMVELEEGLAADGGVALTNKGVPGLSDPWPGLVQGEAPPVEASDLRTRLAAIYGSCPAQGSPLASDPLAPALPAPSAQPWPFDFQTACRIYTTDRTNIGPSGALDLLTSWLNINAPGCDIAAARSAVVQAVRKTDERS